MGMYVGIDPGTHTGVALWDGSAFRAVVTLPLHRALEVVRDWAGDDALTVVFEDARQRRYLPRERSVSEYRGKLMGAGAVKRDCAIWEEFCRDNGIPYEAVPPRPGLTKYGADAFASLTGWRLRCSEHARDAALLVFGRR